MPISKDQIKIHNGYVWAGNQKIPLLTGEFHFWRNTKCYWPRIINSIKDLGFKHITTYVEWDFHRITPDGTPLGQIKYDFTGSTDQQRDLAGYLDFVEKNDLWLSIRPGPYIYAETEFEGPPKEAIQYHRNHPKFLELADDYLKNVCKIIKPHLVTNGGRIIMCQLDNEVSMIKKSQQVLDAPVEEPSSFRAFIKEKYETVEKAAKNYGYTHWNDWDDVEPTIMPANMGEFKAYLDTAAFLEWYDALFFKNIANMYTKYGIDVPFYVNSTGFPFPHDPDRLRSFVDLCTTDLYYLKTDTLINMLGLNAKYLKATAPAVVSGEFRSGGGETFDDDDYLYQALLWMGYGFHGVNYFMLVERNRWWNTPIDAVGRPLSQKRYDNFKKICTSFNKIDFPRFTDYSTADINLLWYRMHAFADKYAPMEPPFVMDFDFNNNFMFKTLLRANVMFDIWYPKSPFSNIKKHPFFIYAGHDFCEQSVAFEIMNYIKDGGTAVFFYNFPIKDNYGEKLDLFTDYLATPIGSYRVSGGSGVTYKDKMFSIITPIFIEYRIPKQDKDEYEIFFYKHMCVGYTKKIGKGKAVVLGFDTPIDVLPSILESIGWQPSFKISQSGVLGTLYSIPETKELLLTAINPTDKPVDAYVRLNLKKLNIEKFAESNEFIGESLFTKQSIPKLNLEEFTLRLPSKGGSLFYIKPK
jgi:beta-galactosidase GanA